MNDSTIDQPPDMSDLLAVIRGMVGEVHPHWKNLHFLPDTHLERELGLDSMARAELRIRIEQSLQISLSENAAVCASSANDLMRAITYHLNGEDCLADDGMDGKATDLLMGEFGTADISADRPVHTVRDWLYALYTWPVFGFVIAITWLLVVLTPFDRWRRKMAHWCARLFFILTFTPLEVEGQEHLKPDRAQIIIANHTSYLDGFIVTAALDIPIHFIVKGELARIAPVRLLLQRFGVEFVDRFNAGKSTSDVSRIANKSRNGQSIVFFPEGTFTTFEGLQPFRMGAFVTATRAKAPVVPVAIRGARNIIRGKDWFPTRGRIRVTILPPIQPTGDGWQVALDLRNAARKEIVPWTGEVDLVGE